MLLMSTVTQYCKVWGLKLDKNLKLEICQICEDNLFPV